MFGDLIRLQVETCNVLPITYTKWCCEAPFDIQVHKARSLQIHFWQVIVQHLNENKNIYAEEKERETLIQNHSNWVNLILIWEQRKNSYFIVPFSMCNCVLDCFFYIVKPHHSFGSCSDHVTKLSISDLLLLIERGTAVHYHYILKLSW